MRKPFALFHINGERGFRGGERQLLYLAAVMRARGHRNVIVCREGQALSREAARRNFERLHLPLLGEWDLYSALRLRRAAAAACETAILHAHTGHAAATAFLASRGGKARWLVHRRVDFHLGGIFSRRFKYGLAPKIVAVSEGIRSVLTQDGLSPERIAVIPDMIPLGPEESALAGSEADPFLPPSPEERARIRKDISGQLGLDPAAHWIGNLAAHVPHKDQRTLIQAADILLRTMPNARFLLIGSGPETAALKALARELGVSACVLFPGQAFDPKPWLKSLDLYVQSSWGEGMGSVLLEAAAVGVPIAATTAGGIPEVVEDGVSGLLVPPRSPERLAEAMRSCLVDLAAARARACTAQAGLVRFSLKSIGEKMEALYGEIAS